MMKLSASAAGINEAERDEYIEGRIALIEGLQVLEAVSPLVRLAAQARACGIRLVADTETIGILKGMRDPRARDLAAVLWVAKPNGVSRQNHMDAGSRTSIAAKFMAFFSKTSR